MNIRLSLLVAATVVPSAFATTVSGAGNVTLDGTTYALWGIEAPAPAQTCSGGWPAGQLAEQALARLVEGKTVTCEARDKDRLGRTVAVCKADGVDLGEALVREGMAWARLGVSHGYVVQEAQAASRFLGVHNHHCEQPDIWRSKNEQFQRNEGGGLE
ncbi:MAG: thermonuclease family protein [Proteobacteria bacterium]|nr:thermonuclease family protein [Pseudomonadota bacterium]